MKAKLTIILFLFSICFSLKAQDEYVLIDTIQRESAYPHSLSISEDGKYIAYGCASFYIKVIKSDFTEYKTFELSDSYGGLGPVFSKDSRLIAYYALGEKDTLQVYNLELEKQFFYIYQNFAQEMFFINNDTIMLYNRDGIITYISAKSGLIISKIEEKDGLRGVYYDKATDKYYILLKNGKLKLLSVEKGILRNTILKLPERVYDLKITEDIICYSKDKKLSIYNRKSKQYLYQGELNIGYITDIAIDDSLIYISGRSKSYLVYNINSNQFTKSKYSFSEIGIFEIFILDSKCMILSDEYNLYLLMKK